MQKLKKHVTKLVNHQKQYQKLLKKYQNKPIEKITKKDLVKMVELQNTVCMGEQ